MDKTYYLKAIGNNRFTGDGSWQWLKIRGFKAMKNKVTGKEHYEIEVRTKWGSKYVMVNDFNPQFLKFKDEQGKPVTFIQVIKYFKNRSIGLLIS